MQRIEPLCVLDFFVAEAWQRHGVGRRLFDTMLSHEHTLPARMGYDRPSPKFLSFLQRHFRLQKFLPQTNGFVVFDDYFLGTMLGKIVDSPLFGVSTDCVIRARTFHHLCFQRRTVPSMSSTPAESKYGAVRRSLSIDTRGSDARDSSVLPSPQPLHQSHLQQQQQPQPQRTPHPRQPQNQTVSPQHIMLGNAPSADFLNQHRRDPARHSPPPAQECSPNSISASQTSFFNGRRMSAVAAVAAERGQIPGLQASLQTTQQQQQQQQLAQPPHYQSAHSAPAVMSSSSSSSGLTINSGFPKSAYRASFESTAATFESRSFQFQPKTSSSGGGDSIDSLMREGSLPPAAKPHQQSHSNPPHQQKYAPIPDAFRRFVEPPQRPVDLRALVSPSAAAAAAAIMQSSGGAGSFGRGPAMRTGAHSLSMQDYRINGDEAAFAPVRVVPPRNAPGGGFGAQSSRPW